MSYRCPKCKGTNVEELLLVWTEANTGRVIGESCIADAYEDKYFCRDCDDMVPFLVESPDEE